MPTVTLPWPDKRLLPNARVHWAVKAKAVRKARLDSAWWAKAAGFKRMKAEAVDVKITFHPPDRRKRDRDGMLSSIKAHLDGISDVVGIDDNEFRITFDKGDPREGGCVVIELAPVHDPNPTR